MKLRRFTAVLLAGFAAGILTTRAADKEAAAKPFPSAKCLISDEKLGSMGKPHVVVVDGQELKFCCKSCVKDYEKGNQPNALAKAQQLLLGIPPPSGPVDR